MESVFRYDETMSRLAGEPRDPDIVMDELAKRHAFVVLDGAPLTSLGCSIFWVRHDTPLPDLPTFVQPLTYSLALLTQWSKRQSALRITLPEDVWQIALD